MHKLNEISGEKNLSLITKNFECVNKKFIFMKV